MDGLAYPGDPVGIISDRYLVSLPLHHQNWSIVTSPLLNFKCDLPQLRQEIFREKGLIAISCAPDPIL